MIITDILPVLGAIAGGAVTITTFYKKVLKPLIAAVKKINKTIITIEKIEEEFKPNGGGSLRDAINRIENSLLLEQQTRRVMSMALEVAIIESNADGFYLWVNQAFTNISGLTPTDAKNYGWVTAIDPKEREAVTAEWELAIKQKRTFQMEYRIVNINTGIPTKVSALSFPISNEKGILIGHVGILSPVNY